MTMTEFQDQQIKLSIKTLAVWAIGIVSLVSSFWIGYSSIMEKLNIIENKIQIQDIRIGNEIDKAGVVHAEFDKRVSKIEIGP